MERARSYVRWFSELGVEDVGSVGGKNASLGEMYRTLVPLGIDVPNGFAITADAYRYTLDTAGAWDPLRETLAGLDIKPIRKHKPKAKAELEAPAAKTPEREVGEATAGEVAPEEAAAPAPAPEPPPRPTEAPPTPKEGEVSKEPPDAKGTQFGQYVLQEHIATGGMAEVFQGVAEGGLCAAEARADFARYRALRTFGLGRAVDLADLLAFRGAIFTSGMPEPVVESALGSGEFGLICPGSSISSLAMRD
mgnify:CR=1 FL=1